MTLKERHQKLVKACEEFLQVQRDDPDTHDWSQCESDDEIERQKDAVKYTCAMAACSYKTFEEEVEKYR